MSLIVKEVSILFFIILWIPAMISAQEDTKANIEHDQ